MALVTSELYEKSVAELTTDLVGLLKQQFKLRVVKASGELSQSHLLKQVRRDIARINTVLSTKRKGDK